MTYTINHLSKLLLINVALADTFALFFPFIRLMRCIQKDGHLNDHLCVYIYKYTINKNLTSKLWYKNSRDRRYLIQTAQAASVHHFQGTCSCHGNHLASGAEAFIAPEMS